MEKLKLEDFTRYKFLSGITFSPNGKNCGFIMHQIQKDDNKYLSNIHIIDEKKEVRRITSLNEERSFIWKDDRTILFPATRGEKDKERKGSKEIFTSFYEIHIDGGEAVKSFEVPLNVTSIKMMDKDNYLLTGIFDPEIGELYNLSKNEKADKLKSLKEQPSYQIIDEIPFWSNGDTYTNKKRNKLYRYNLSKDELTPITDDFTNVDYYSVDSDRKNVVFLTSSFIDKMSLTTQLNLYSVESDKYEKISPFKNFDYSYCDFIRDRIIFIGKEGKSFGINENPSIYTVELDGSNPTLLLSPDAGLYNSVGSDCRYGGSQSIKIHGDFLYYTTTNGPCSYINKLDLNGSSERLTSSEGSVDGFDIYKDKIYFIGLRNLKLQEIYSHDNIVLTSFNTWVNNEISLSAPERLLVTSEDGTEIEGWVIKPVDYKVGESYPAILDIHGGPKTVYGEVFYHEMQYWANHGYFVFFCNPRGSDGYGNGFADIRGKYGSIDYDDIMCFTDVVLNEYKDIDKERIGVTGGSYGGFMTNWIIGHTSRFKAAASQRSISNWLSFFGTSDIGYFFADDQVGADPWTDAEKMWDQSPLKYADKVTTPTLFIHSEEDYRCWIPEGMQMFTALKYHGVESRFIAFKGENHELSRSGKPKNRIKRLEEITEWFDRHLKDF